MSRPRIGLALGSGSARGWSHIGVIDALAEAGIEYVLAYIPGVAYDQEPMQRFAEDVVPAFS